VDAIRAMTEPERDGKQSVENTDKILRIQA